MNETTTAKHQPLEDAGTWMHASFLAMTFVTGLIGAASYLGLGHVFTANMTGNIVLLGFAAAHVPGLSMIRSAAALGSALVGGVIAGRLQCAFRLRNKRRWLTTAGGIETILLLAASIAAFQGGRNSPLLPA